MNVKKVFLLWNVYAIVYFTIRRVEQAANQLGYLRYLPLVLGELLLALGELLLALGALLLALGVLLLDFGAPVPFAPYLGVPFAALGVSASCRGCKCTGDEVTARTKVKRIKAFETIMTVD
jgi:hypothetical protein